MPDVNVTELRQNLPAYLAKVRAGQHLRVISRGKVIAELSPPGIDPHPAEIARAGVMVNHSRVIPPG